MSVRFLNLVSSTTGVFFVLSVQSGAVHFPAGFVLYKEGGGGGGIPHAQKVYNL